MKIIHYAALTINDTDEDRYGTAELVSGGYLFREDGSATARLIRSQDVNRPYRLMLFGRVDLADTQYIEDELVGGLAAVACTRTEGVN